MALNPKGIVATVRESIDEFMNDDCPSMAAALAYYTAFSLPPLLILILILVGTLVDPSDVRGVIERQIDAFMGPSGGAQVREFLAQAKPPGGDGTIPTIIGIATLAFGATGFFLSLQSALNKAWEVAPDPKQGGVRAFLMKRIFSFGMILGVAFLLLVSLALTALISAFSDRLSNYLPGGASGYVLEIVNLVITLPIVALLFALMFRYIPDAVVAWRDARMGALVTATLFLIGKTIIGLYIGRSNPGQPYGAAGSLAVMLVWIYYTTMILLLGAEITQVFARNHGRQIVPEEGAVRTIVEKRRVRRGDRPATGAGTPPPAPVAASSRADGAGDAMR